MGMCPNRDTPKPSDFLLNWSFLAQLHMINMIKSMHLLLFEYASSWHRPGIWMDGGHHTFHHGNLGMLHNLRRLLRTPESIFPRKISTPARSTVAKWSAAKLTEKAMERVFCGSLDLNGCNMEQQTSDFDDDLVGSLNRKGQVDATWSDLAGQPNDAYWHWDAN